MSNSAGLDEPDADILRRIVTTSVLSSQGTSVKPDGALRERLRCYERTAVALGQDAQTLQVIRSARRLVGDAKALPPDRDGA